MKIYDFKVRNAKGVEVPMTDYQGKVLLIVNTATGSGFKTNNLVLGLYSQSNPFTSHLIC